MDRWSRRQVVQGVGMVGLGLVAGCGRLPGQAPPAKIARLGLLSGGSAEGTGRNREQLILGLQELGYVEGQNISLDYRYVEGQNARAPALAAELVSLPVDVMVIGGSDVVRAAKAATSTIPIVMGYSGADPVAAGFIASLAYPGGNVTGLSSISSHLSMKRLELLKEAVPGSARVGVMTDARTPFVVSRLTDSQRAAELLGLRAQAVLVDSADEVERAVEAAVQEHVDALIVVQSGQTAVLRPQIVELATKNRLPAMYETSDWTYVGGLMAYGASIPAMYHRAAYYVDRILRGTSPADLPVEQPREFDFVINLQTARALGLTIPPHVLLQATEVIQ